jgi:hypothetical protein
MQIIVNRFTSDADTTISTLSVDNRFICFGLEDGHRDIKVINETRIPAGTYAVNIRTVGGLHNRYKKRFSDNHKGMLHILDVPGFEYILIHCGNDNDDTGGCLLVGEGANTRKGNMSITSSVRAYKKLYPKVINAAIMGRLYITFKDNDR